MNAITHLSTARAPRRGSASAIAHYAATDAQAARFAALDAAYPETLSTRAPLWDETLLSRLTQPLSRIRE